MMFRDGLHSNFPQRRVTEEMVKQAQLLDKNKKLQNENNINVSKYRKKSNFVIGDGVLLKNCHKTSKFDPLFEQQPYTITSIDEKANKIVVQRRNTILCRHPDHIKPYFGTYNDVDEQNDVADQGSRNIDDDGFDLKSRNIWTSLLIILMLEIRRINTSCDDLIEIEYKMLVILIQNLCHN